jgi:hypothetical protein
MRAAQQKASRPGWREVRLQKNKATIDSGKNLVPMSYRTTPHRLSPELRRSTFVALNAHHAAFIRAVADSIVPIVASGRKENAVAPRLGIARVRIFKPRCLAADGFRFSQSDGFRRGRRRKLLILGAEYIAHFVPELKVVEDALCLNGVCGRNLAILDHDQMVAVAFLARGRKIARPLEDLGCRKLKSVTTNL